MKTKRIVYLIIAIWLGIIAFFALSNEFTLRTGKEILLKTVPIDPRDLFRGDYVILNYEISQLPNGEDFKPDQKIYVVLNIDKSNIATTNYISKKQPKNEFFIEGVVRKQFRRSRIEYGIESFFVKEHTGMYIQRKLSQGAYVKVSIDRNGRAKIKELIY